MAKTHAQLVAQMAKAFRDAGMIVERGPFEVTNDAGEVVLIAKNRVRLGQMRLPLAAPAAQAEEER